MNVRFITDEKTQRLRYYPRSKIFGGNVMKKIVILFLALFANLSALAEQRELTAGPSSGPTVCNLNMYEVSNRVIDTAATVLGHSGFSANTNEKQVQRVLNGLEIWTVIFDIPVHRMVEVTVTDCTDVSLTPVDSNKIKSCESLDHSNVEPGTLCRTSKNAVLKLYSRNSIGEAWIQPDGDVWAASPLKSMLGSHLDAAIHACKPFDSDQFSFSLPGSVNLTSLYTYGVDEALPSLKSSIFWTGNEWDLYDFKSGRTEDGFFANEANIVCRRHRGQN